MVSYKRKNQIESEIEFNSFCLVMVEANGMPFTPNVQLRKQANEFNLNWIVVLLIHLSLVHSFVFLFFFLTCSCFLLVFPLCFCAIWPHSFDALWIWSDITDNRLDISSSMSILLVLFPFHQLVVLWYYFLNMLCVVFPIIWYPRKCFTYIFSLVREAKVVRMVFRWNEENEWGR